MTEQTAVCRLNLPVNGVHRFGKVKTFPYTNGGRSIKRTLFLIITNPRRNFKPSRVFICTPLRVLLKCPNHNKAKAKTAP